MVQLVTCVLFMSGLQLLWAQGTSGAKCLNGTDTCVTAPDNQCQVGGEMYCCGQGQVIRAVSTNQGQLVTCTCDVPSPSNTGYRCTVRSDNATSTGSTFRGADVSFSGLTCALLVLILLAVAASQ